MFDATCTPDVWLAGYPDWLEGGFAGCALSCGGSSSAQAIASVGRAYRLIRSDPRLTLASTARDIRDARATGRLAVLLHFQGTEPLEHDVNLVEVFWRLGVRIMQLAYNRRGLVCDGCEVPEDRGLSAFGRAVIAEMNRLGVPVDLSHTGTRSCREALEVSSGPCIASHSNAQAVRAHPRNLPDEVIRGIAQSGGMVGMNGFPAFVADHPAPTLDEFIDHIVHIDDLVGPGHVGLGLDYCQISDADYQEMLDSGEWRAEDYPPPPWSYPSGIESPRTIGRLAERMRERRFSESEIRGVLGENWLSLYDRVWPS